MCRYGKNGVCPSLPVEGVSDKDYEAHVKKNHTKLEEGEKIKFLLSHRFHADGP